jgi:hypothetical protein
VQADCGAIIANQIFNRTGWARHLQHPGDATRQFFVRQTAEPKFRNDRMASITPVDFSGARGSNAGDQFHELWALEQSLKLLQPGTTLEALTVEGVHGELADGSTDKSSWDGVDCAMYYGGDSLQTADHIELAQLKYSAANPDTAWTIARLAYSSGKKTNNSVIRRLANSFKNARAAMKAGASLSVKLVSNQSADAELIAAANARWSGDVKKAGLSQYITDALATLGKASGLNAQEFSEFIATVDLSECGADSRFATEEKIIATIASLMGDDVTAEARQLQSRIRDLMLPERLREVITEASVVTWFGLSGKAGLFPAPADITLPAHPIPRETAREAAKAITNGARLLVVHGEGGCGKTTLVHQIRDYLPDGSIQVVFDCFGGGSYLYSEDKRHLPEAAFLQLTNDLANAVKLPLFYPRSITNPASIKTFLAKAAAAAKSFAAMHPGALVLIIIDAADNAVTAAMGADPKERPFIFDLFEANLASLPDSIRFVVSCRSGRRDTLQIPANATQIPCPPFTEDETRLHLTQAFGEVDAQLVHEFYELSQANPRVQNYAIKAADGREDRVLQALLPAGKSLAEVLQRTIESALEKLGQRNLFEKLIGGLAYLPPPIALGALAGVANTTEAIVRDFASDLWPGVRLREDGVTVADEDFDGFLRARAQAAEAQTRAAIADHFSRTYPVDAYSSVHLADSYVHAGRSMQLLRIIETDPQAAAISDPVLRRQTQVRRLKLSLSACRRTGTVLDALKVILISADAHSDDHTLQEVLRTEMDLSVEFGGASVRRDILLNSDRMKSHGTFLAQDAARAVRSNNNISAIEALHFHDEWLKRRNSVPKEERGGWKVDIDDIAARAEAILELRGAKAAVNELRRWTPRSVPVQAAISLVPRLLASGKSGALAELLSSGEIPQPWDLLLAVPLALSGHPPDPARLEKSLAAVRARYFGSAPIGRGYGEEHWPQTVYEYFVLGCEAGFAQNVDQAVLGRVLGELAPLIGKNRGALYVSDAFRTDMLLRTWLLQQGLSGVAAPKADEFINFVDSLNPPPAPTDKKVRKENGRDDYDQKNETERRNRKLRTLFSVYSARLSVLSAAAANQTPSRAQIDALAKVDSYQLGEDFDTIPLRSRIGHAIIQLMIVPGIAASELLEKAAAVITGRFSDALASQRIGIWNVFRMRTNSAAELVKIVIDVAKSIKENRFASSDKLQGLLNLSRVLLPVSPGDAQGLFNDAVEIAKEIDREAMDQIEFLSAAAQRAGLSEVSSQTKAAVDIATFVSGAAVRLSDMEGFPWRSAIAALVALKPEIAILSVARWQDEALLDLNSSIRALLVAGLHKGSVPMEILASLLPLLSYQSDEALSALLRGAVKGSTPDLQEQIALDIQLLCPQEQRARIAEECQDIDGTGQWLSLLRQTGAFTAAIKAQDKPASAESSEDLAPKPGTAPRETYVLDIVGKRFADVGSILGVFEDAEKSGLSHTTTVLLSEMRSHVEPRDRAAFLEAVLQIPAETLRVHQRARVVREAINEWKETPAIANWCKNRLPDVIAENLHGFARWIEEGSSSLRELLDCTGADNAKRTEIILAGVSAAGENIGSKTLYYLAILILEQQDQKTIADILLWYAHLVRMRLYADEQDEWTPKNVPQTLTEALGRFFFALFSDIDTRIRWRAAQAVRRAARLGQNELVESLATQIDRMTEPEFRDPDAPFYFLAAKLWTAITFARVAVETPDALKNCKAALNDLLSDQLPHFAIREYAKNAMSALAKARVIHLTKEEAALLAGVNKPKRSVSAKNIYGRTFRGMGRNRRFDFDEMDSLPYWYEDLLRSFPTATQDQILTIAEKWLIDEWKAPPKVRWWDHETRKGRYDERQFGLWSHRHGSMSTVERYGTYLEWHAMQCAAGELVQTMPVRKGEDYYDRFDYFVQKYQPSKPPFWLSDFRGQTPLERRLWSLDPRSDRGWLHNARGDEFLDEVFRHHRENWIAVDASISTRYWRARHMDVHISSALVSPATAASLVRAYQTAGNAWDIVVPYEQEDDRNGVDHKGYRLKGWLQSIERDLRFDERDPLRNETRYPTIAPGTELRKFLSEPELIGFAWIWNCKETGQPALMHEAWSDEPRPERDHYERSMKSDGSRLFVRPEMLARFLKAVGMDLIVEVKIDRNIDVEKYSYDEKDKHRKTHWKIIHFTKEGQLADAAGNFGAWPPHHAAVGRESSRRSQPLDGPPRRRTDSRRRKAAG